MKLYEPFQQHWQAAFPHLNTHNCRLLVTVSGGVDSVVLLDLLVHSGFELVIAHCNFGLRGQESERDEAFVRSLAVQYGKELLVKHFDTQVYANAHQIAIQEAARTLRYDWFNSIIEDWQTGSNAVAKKCITVTAHHADDDIETLLMHFFRGTGINGLAGMKTLQEDRHLLRPLLVFRKAELSAHALENGLQFVEDSSNAIDKYTRNFFRNQLIPQISEVYPQVETNLLQNIQRFRETAELYTQAVQLQVKKLIEVKGTEIHIPVLKWKKASPLHTITWEISKPYGFTAAQTEEIIKLLDAGNGAYCSSATHRMIRNRQWIIISPLPGSQAGLAAQQAAHLLVEADDTKIDFENGTLSIRKQTKPVVPSHQAANTALINAAAVQFPLLLRKWKQGDYFYPLGMQKKKKLSRFFIDNKLSTTDKEKVWVLESNKKIIWVVGLRLDDRFKITPNTHSALLFSVEKNNRPQ